MNLRAPFVPGRLDTYFVPTVGHVDALLLLLSARLEHLVGAVTEDRVRADIDLLLDRRAALTERDRPRTKDTAA